MKYLKSHVWNYLFGEPFRWLLYYFFQPDRFKREIEIKDFSIRIRFLMRLIIPMFLVSYPVALVLPIIYLQSNWISVLLITALGTMLGVTVGITWDILVKSPVGIVSSMWLGFWTGFWMGIAGFSGLAVWISAIGGIVLGTVAVSGKKNLMSIEDCLMAIDKYFTRLFAELKAAKHIKFLMGIIAELVGGLILDIARRNWNMH